MLLYFDVCKNHKHRITIESIKYVTQEMFLNKSTQMKTLLYFVFQWYVYYAFSNKIKHILFKRKGLGVA